MILLYLLSLILAVGATSTQCRCRPHESCWPSEEDWVSFNKSINGHLIRLRPVGAVCHGDEYNEEACADVQNNTSSSSWRAAEPGALESTNWEASGEDTPDCDVAAPRDSPCRQGRIPLYAALAESAEEIQAAVRFAKRQNLRVAVTNTGHGGVGVSAASDSLQINTSRLRRIETVEEFVPAGGTEVVGRVVTMGAGVLTEELARAAADEGFTVIMGLCDTIGIAGGYIQGGGVGLLGSAFGMGSDNAVEFNVVTADGDLVVANESTNEDLFWALRGGGGGTFGIAVNTTVRALPDIKGTVFRVSAVLPQPNSDPGPDPQSVIFDITRQIVAAFPKIKNADAEGTASAFVLATIGLDGSFIVQSEIVFPAVDPLPADQQEELNKLTTALENLGYGDAYTTTLTAYPHLSQYLRNVGPVPPYGRIEGSVLYSEELYHSADGANLILDIVFDHTYGPGDILEFFMTGGGQLRANKDLIDSALNPTWRDVGLYVSARRALASSDASKRFGENNPMVALREIERPSLGSYYNVADLEEPDWPGAFWGDNYERLYQVKQEWDEDGLFVVNLGVGSEDWDEENMCRVD
ncbi:hypothetical protein BJY04DRAFT_212114 [Aspergillus karnatakaensis]|uniref:FAD-dependent oxidoreductase n=1 Tax=Aspergillus karnatakaensis TaxID=1810916 RepID=UPI003CCCF746